ncbi:MAG TPA: bifunctional precorrin-2 dehydrogenase/sirohydrochlorin ferrochelatase [Syntrophobacteraceae bacterium]|nr:bifunctional precorrin-2 dehydrogenase/sirohydrochlorin ferrochelatase [Syntrophobacteraceae bacterium]
MNLPYYPMFVTLARRVCLVVGGGSVGERKTRSLLEYGCSVRLVAEFLTPWLQNQCAEGTVLLIGKTYTKPHLENVDLVFAATSDMETNRAIAADAEEQRIWCNMATEPEWGSFILPCVLRRGPLTIAISTGGASPAVAMQIKRKLEHEFGKEWIVMLQLMAMLRTTIQSKGLTSDQNQKLYHQIAGLPLLQWVLKQDQEQVLQAITNICHPWINRPELVQIWNEAWKHSA